MCVSSLWLDQHVDPSEGLVVFLLRFNDFARLNCRLRDSVHGEAPVEALEVAFPLLACAVSDADVDTARRQHSVDLIESELHVHLRTVTRQDAIECALINNGLVLTILNLGQLLDVGLLVGNLNSFLLVVLLHLLDDDSGGVDVRNFLVPVVSHVLRQS